MEPFWEGPALPEPKPSSSFRALGPPGAQASPGRGGAGGSPRPPTPAQLRAPPPPRHPLTSPPHSASSLHRRGLKGLAGERVTCPHLGQGGLGLELGGPRGPGTLSSLPAPHPQP